MYTVRYDLQPEYQHTNMITLHIRLYWVASEGKKLHEQSVNSYQYWISIDLTGVQLGPGPQLLMPELK